MFQSLRVSLAGEKDGRAHDFQAIESVPEQLFKIPPVKRDKDIGPCQCRKKDGAVFGYREHHDPIKANYVVHDEEAGPQLHPVWACLDKTDTNSGGLVVV